MDRFAEWFARPYVALCFLAFGMAVIPLNDALIKLLGDTMPCLLYTSDAADE